MLIFISALFVASILLNLATVRLLYNKLESLNSKGLGKKGSICSAKMIKTLKDEIENVEYKQYRGFLVFKDGCYINTLHTTDWKSSEEKVDKEINAAKEVFVEYILEDNTIDVTYDILSKPN